MDLQLDCCDNDNDSFSQPKGQSTWAVAAPWLAKEIRSMHKVIDQGTPLRSLAA